MCTGEFPVYPETHRAQTPRVGHPADRVPRHLTHARQEIRCHDPFLSAFLGQARRGELSWTMYNMIHGHPTLETGSWLPSTGRPTCGDPACTLLTTQTWPRMIRDNPKVDWDHMRAGECVTCSAERKRRCRVMRQDCPSCHTVTCTFRERQNGRSAARGAIGGAAVTRTANSDTCSTLGWQGFSSGPRRPRAEARAVREHLCVESEGATDDGIH